MTDEKKCECACIEVPKGAKFGIALFRLDTGEMAVEVTPNEGNGRPEYTELLALLCESTYNIESNMVTEAAANKTAEKVMTILTELMGKKVIAP